MREVREKHCMMSLTEHTYVHIQLKSFWKVAAGEDRDNILHRGEFWCSSLHDKRAYPFNIKGDWLHVCVQQILLPT